MPSQRGRRRTRPKKFEDEEIASYPKNNKIAKREPVEQIDENSNQSISSASSVSLGRPRRSVTMRKSVANSAPPPPKKAKGRPSKKAIVEPDSEDEAPIFAVPSDVEESQSSEDEVTEEEPETTDSEEEKESEEEDIDESAQIMRNKLDIALRFYDKKDIPELELPESSKDLLLSNEYLFRAMGIYETLQRFYLALRLSPFRFEDFCIVLMIDEQSYLLSEIHICLLKALMREDESAHTHYCAQEFRDSLNVYLTLCDHLTWPEVLRIYLASDLQKNSHVIKNLLTPEYPFVSIEKKLELLEYLLEEFAYTTKFRDSLNPEVSSYHDDHCRACLKGGDLVCCESCPATFHLLCLDPPLRSPPVGYWDCPLCKQNAVAGVTDCKLEPKLYGCLTRHEPIGYDRHGRKYWFLSRRIIVEDTREGHEDSLFYYSTKYQFDELLDSIDENDYEEDLYKTLKDLEDTIIEQMGITERLTKAAKGSRKSYIEAVNEELSLKRAHKLRLENAETQHFQEPLHSELDLLENSGGIQTRLRTGTIQPRNSNSEALRNKSSVYNLISSFRDEDYRIVPDESGQGLTKVLKKSVTAEFVVTDLFKLGLEGNFKNYQNLFVTNIHALNKAQQNEERDRKKHLQAKFSIHFDLRWGEYNNVSVQTAPHSQYGNKDSLLDVIKQALLYFESKIPNLFYHPLWGSSRTKWMQAVTMSKEMKNFCLAFNILESHLKPLLFTTGFHELLGFTILQRSTQLERDELKKKEKKEKGKSVDTADGLALEGDSVNQGRYGTGGNAVKLIKIKLKHQIWKSRGEEFRLSGVGGWRWNLNLTLPVTDRINSKPEVLQSVDANSNVPEDDLINISEDLKSDQRRFYSSYPTEDWNVLLDKRLEMLQFEKTNKASSPNNSITTNSLNSKVPSESTCADSSSENKKPNVYLHSCYSALCDRKNCYSPLCLSQTKEAASSSQVDVGLNAECKSENANVAEDKVYLVVEHVDLRKVDIVNNVRTLVPKTYNLPQRVRKVPTDRFKCDKYLSYFFLTYEEHIALARRAGDKEIVGFSYSAKSNFALWDYGLAPRPNFRLHWLMRTLNLQNVPAIALQLRVLFSSIRWDDLSEPPPVSGTYTITSESDVTTIELLNKRDLPPCGLRSEYKVRRIVVPLDIPTITRRDSSTPARSGLRTRKKPEINDVEGPKLQEAWEPEELLPLWQMLQYQKNFLNAKQREQNEAIRKKNEEARKLAQQAQQQKAQAAAASSAPRTTAPTISIPIRASVGIPQRPLNASTASPQSFMIRSNTGQIMRLPTSVIPATRLANGQHVIFRPPNGAYPLTFRSASPMGTASPRFTLASGARPINLVQNKPVVIRTSGISTPTTGMPVNSPGNSQRVQIVPVRTTDGRNFIIQINSNDFQYVTTKEDSNIKTPTTSGTVITPQKIILKPSGATPSPSVPVLSANVLPNTTFAAAPSTSTQTTPSGPVENKEPTNLNKKEEPESSAESQMVITTEMTQEIIRKALLNEGNNTAISQKLMALQKHHQEQKLETSGSPHEEDDFKDPSYRQPRSTPSSSTSRSVRKSRSNRSTKSRYDSSDYVYNIPKSEKKDRPSRTIIPVEKENIEMICQNVMKNMLDQIQRQEKRRKQDEINEERKQKKVKQDRQKFVTTHTEILRRYIARKKAKFNLNIRKTIQAEIFAKLNDLKPKIIEQKPVPTITIAPLNFPPQAVSATTKSAPATVSTTPSAKRISAAVKRKHTDETINGNAAVDAVHKSPKAKRQRRSESNSGGRGSGVTNGRSKSPELFCVCRKPYDDSRFMAGCDSCPNWYHPPCINMSEDDFSSEKPFTCPECLNQNGKVEPTKTQTVTPTPRKAKGRPRNNVPMKEITPIENNNNEEEDGKKYCVCSNRTNDLERFLVFCDDCQCWFHGRCVGVTETEAQSIDKYQCPECSDEITLNRLNLISIFDSNSKEPARILKTIQNHPDAWPFVRAVDKKQVPDYYDIIKEPIDLKKIESRLTSKSYEKFGEFVYDIKKMFENCRFYNGSATVYCQLATNLEKVFKKELETFRSSLARS